MINLNKDSEWKKHRAKMEAEFKEIKEYPRIIRCNKGDDGRFTAVSLEGGLNIMYKIPTKEITIWGVGKRYSNGYISYEDLVAKVEIFKKMMENVEY